MEKYNKLIDKVKLYLADYELEIDLAIRNMDIYRCGLDSASVKIVDLIEDAIKEWCEENEIDYNDFDTYNMFGKDIIDIFWDAVDNEQ